MQQPLAVAIISGLLVQVPMVVIVMPLLYKWLTGIRNSTAT
jgi:multidrug efflux pump subunit AcrB